MVRLFVNPTFTPLTFPSSHPVPWDSTLAGPLTCPAVVKFQRALDAEGLLTGATPVPVLAVHLGRGQRVSERRSPGEAQAERAP